VSQGPVDRPYRVERNPFASGLLAGQVGVLTLTRTGKLPAEAGQWIGSDARAAGYDLVTFASSEPMELDGFQDLGTLEEYGAGRRDVSGRLTAAPHFDIVQLQPEQWPAIEDVLAFASPTRFSRDQRLSPDVVKRHKLALLKSYQERWPQYSLVAQSRSQPDRLWGLQASYVTGRTFVLYELLTESGLVAVDLLVNNLERVGRWQPEVDRVATWVYSDNHRSRSFLTRLGLQATGQRTHHYHLWP
jgi:hypothetical protein